MMSICLYLSVAVATLLPMAFFMLKCNPTDPLFGRTLWAYFQEHAAGAVSLEDLEQYMAFRVSCGQFSYAEAPKAYCVMLGVTGTLEQTLKLSFEKQVLEDVYKIESTR